jgi:hypothetical protein
MKSEQITAECGVYKSCDAQKKTQSRIIYPPNKEVSVQKCLPIPLNIYGALNTQIS